ncbi:uncharacterized protein LOC111284442 [Durio zibethinus]|uniref:Uncharacterized protein LOC111284442 n=1 Tax=Durio zibethinus TaxID=66656 RepID=A0A6P5XLP5_DURZI|nr:uncharacterized protein LOC111284442 [Durio zibethinus]
MGKLKSSPNLLKKRWSLTNQLAITCKRSISETLATIFNSVKLSKHTQERLDISSSQEVVTLYILVMRLKSYLSISSMAIHYLGLLSLLYLKTIQRISDNLVEVFSNFNAGFCLCVLNDITVGSVRTGKEIQGKPEWKVAVTNNCKSTQHELKLACQGFQSVETEDPTSSRSKVTIASSSKAML